MTKGGNNPILDPVTKVKVPLRRYRATSLCFILSKETKTVNPTTLLMMKKI